MATPEVMAGRELTLSVSISGFNIPLTSITWTQQGRTLNGSEDRVTITNTTTPPATVVSTLVIAAVTPAEAGNYTITATNGAGSSMSIFTVDVTGIQDVETWKCVVKQYLCLEYVQLL